MKTMAAAVLIFMLTAVTAQAQGYGSYSGFDSRGRYYFGNTYDNGYGSTSWSGFDGSGRYNYGTYNYRPSYRATPYYYGGSYRSYRFSDSQRRRINRYYGFPN